MLVSAATRAIARREWGAYFNSPVAYVFIIIFLLLSGFFTFAVAGFYESNQGVEVAAGAVSGSGDSS